jgi:uncharacterized protein
MILFLSLPVFAQDMGTEVSRIVDNAGLLDAGQTAYLAGRIASIARTYNFDIVILTETDIGASHPSDWADNFFDDNGYGFGPYRDGSIFLQVTGSRDYWFSNSGRGIKILNNTAFNKLEADTVKFLSDGNPFEAYNTFISLWEQFLALEANGRSYNFFYRWNAVLVSIVWAMALIIGGAVVLVWKSKMNTALKQARADAYVVQGSLVYKEKNDRFLYSTITKTRRETESSSGGGSSRSSSSRGRGGKY